MKKRFLKGSYQNNTGYVRKKISKNNVHGMQTSGSIDEELWMLLEYYSEIEESGYKLLSSNGITHKGSQKKIFKEFQAYIRQAKGYYKSAKNLPARSSALLYYYCFLNLAKALIITKKPQELKRKKVPHGLTYRYHSDSDLSKHTVKVVPKGVFPSFYEIINEEPITKIDFNIQTLLSYCSDISYQCQIASINEQKLLLGKFASVIHKDEKKVWGLLAVFNGIVLELYPSSFQDLFENYEVVDVPHLTCREIFDIGAPEQQSFLFLQEKQKQNFIGGKYIPEFSTIQKVIKSFNNHLQVNYFENDYDFIVSLPYKVRNQIVMNEVTAIYIVTYYFSNLVRYHPAFLEKLLSKKEAWLIDSFLKSSTTTFLRIVASKISNIEFVISSR